ncbi:hypothetical protein NA56DRAFT_587799, partial [Hyaloscypha hepaticicola]
SPKYSSSELSLDLKSFPLIYEKTQCIFFYISKNKKKTFSQPVKIIDRIESHLYKEPGLTIACRYPVYEASKKVLETVDKFKRYIKEVHNILLRGS